MGACVSTPSKTIKFGRNTITGSKIPVERFPIQSLMAPTTFVHVDTQAPNLIFQLWNS
jgi:hypothetical protein